MLHLNASFVATEPIIPCLGDRDSVIKTDPFQTLKAEGTLFPVSQVNWPEFPHCPETNVFAGYTADMLWLNFCVKNDYMRAHAVHDQDPVYDDSCVEFFIRTGSNYMNFEFNCLGICLSAIGPDRKNRIPLPDSVLSRIIRFSSLSRENVPEEGELCDWELTVGIPLSIVGLHKGRVFYGNFYKCGHKTKVPHYLSWAPIGTEEPNFHCPEFFSAIRLKTSIEELIINDYK